MGDMPQAFNQSAVFSEHLLYTKCLAPREIVLIALAFQCFPR